MKSCGEAHDEHVTVRFKPREIVGCRGDAESVRVIVRRVVPAHQFFA